MKYAIISINEDRAAYKSALRSLVDLPEVYLEAFNAIENNPQPEIGFRDIAVSDDYDIKLGELGVWISNLRAWELCVELDETMVVFEDDAMVDPSFNLTVPAYLEELPESDWDFMTLWVPHDQLFDYSYNVIYDGQGRATVLENNVPESRSMFRYSAKIAKAYQGYGCVAVMYSPRGAARLLKLVRDRGIFTPVDCFIYTMAHVGEVRGFAPHPGTVLPVNYDWSSKTTIHTTERLKDAIFGG